MRSRLKVVINRCSDLASSFDRKHSRGLDEGETNQGGPSFKSPNEEAKSLRETGQYDQRLDKLSSFGPARDCGYIDRRCEDSRTITPFRPISIMDRVARLQSERSFHS